MQPLQNCIGPTIRIGREILCLPYAGFLQNVLSCPQAYRGAGPVDNRPSTNKDGGPIHMWGLWGYLVVFWSYQGGENALLKMYS